MTSWRGVCREGTLTIGCRSQIIEEDVEITHHIKGKVIPKKEKKKLTNIPESVTDLHSSYYCPSHHEEESGIDF